MNHNILQFNSFERCSWSHYDLFPLRYSGRLVGALMKFTTNKSYDTLQMFSTVQKMLIVGYARVRPHNFSLSPFEVGDTVKN